VPTFSHDGDVLAYDDAGQGPAIVLLPGMGDRRSAWRHVAPRLVDAGFRALALDLRGHGDSGAGFARFDPEAVAGDVLALLDHVGVRSAVLVGNSAAAGSAVWAALAAPERVDGLALVGPVVRPERAPRWLAWLSAALFLPWWGGWLWGRYYRTLFKGGVPADHDAHVAAVAAGLRERRRRAAMLENGLVGKPGHDRLGRVRAPALVVMGTADPDFPDARREAAEVGEALRAQIVLLDGVGHYPHMERPDALLDVLLPFARSACRASD
jgi:pimeloyl-ACP methyl ester carboxylesterase